MFDFGANMMEHRFVVYSKRTQDSWGKSKCSKRRIRDHDAK
jgi:hypothetical protein